MPEREAEIEPKGRNTALLFTGQGVSPKDIIDCYQILSAENPDLAEGLIQAQQAIDKINPQASFDIMKSLRDQYSADYKSTAFIQPVVYTLSYHSYKLASSNFQAELIEPSFVAGHSLGEYAALTAAGVFSFEKGLEIVTFRGKVMQEACEINNSVLISIVGLEDSEVETIAQETESQIALYNAPSRIVIGAASQKADEIKQMAYQKGSTIRADTLLTAGAFHSRFMQEASDKLDKFLDSYAFEDPKIPVVANITGDKTTSGTALKNHLVESLVSPVRWSKSIKTMMDSGVEIFIECGPGNILTSLNRFNNVEVPTVNATTLI